jgi:hypothetical protein
MPNESDKQPPVVTLLNDCLRVAAVPALGGKMISLVRRASNREFLLAGDDAGKRQRPSYGDSFEDAMPSGIDECFPTVQACRYPGATDAILLPAHEETSIDRSLDFLACGLHPVVPEICPNDVHGMAMTVPVLLQSLANAVVVLVFPFAFRQIGKAVTFGFLAAMSLSQAIFTWKGVPETRNKTLEEIEEFWTQETRTQN